MPLDFPSSPTNGQTYTYNDRTWTYDGTAWNLSSSGGGGGGGGATNLSITAHGADSLTIASDTGSDAVIPAATTSLAGLESAADKTKLNGIAAGATVNSPDAQLRDRATHTGTQGLSSVAGVAASRLVGRGSGGAGVLEEIIVGSGLSLSGTTLSAPGGGGGSPLAVYSDATELSAAAQRLTFSGAGATISEPTPDQIVVNIPGAAGGTVTMKVKTPYDFGAVGGGAVDDTAALQAFFDHAFTEANRRDFYYDWSGDWLVRQTMYIAYKLPTGVIDYPLRMRGGRLVVDLVANLPGGVPLENVLIVHGTRQLWDGTITIMNVNGYTSYNLRGFYTGVLVMLASQSWLPAIRVDGARRDSVFSAAYYPDPYTLRPGTPYEISGTSRNNIGLYIKGIYSRNCGTRANHTSQHKTITSKVEGSVGTGTFVPGSGNNSPSQRTQVTVASTADLRLDDFVVTRFETLPATYTSIAADNAGKTITWTSGDPYAAGWRVGDRFYLLDDNNVGANDNDLFIITGFSGTSNRTITVAPTDPFSFPVTETARVYSAMVSEWEPSLVREIPSSTTVNVYPWITQRNNSKLVPVQGWVFRTYGGDTANTRIGTLIGLDCAGVCFSYGLYGVQIDTLESDHADFGLATGLPNQVCLGNSVSQFHMEGAIVNWLQMNPVGATDLTGQSVMDLSRVMYLSPRGNMTDLRLTDTSLKMATLHSLGNVYSSRVRGEGGELSYFNEAGGSALGNTPTFRNGLFVGAGGTVELTCDFDALRLFGQADAELYWVGTGAAAPTGTLTFTLGPTLTKFGWTLAGDTVTTNPGRRTLFTVRYIQSTKTVIITEVTKASGGGGGTNATNLSLGTITATVIPVLSDTGTDVNLPVFGASTAGLVPGSGGGTTNFLRADGIWSAPPSGGGGGATNLSLANHGATSLDILSDTGSDVTLPAATTSLAGLQSAADKTKLNGIATGATANSTDAQLRDRSTHTGTQAPATIAFAAADRLLGRATAGAGTGEEIICTPAGRALIDDADAAAQRATLDAEQLGVLVGINTQTASYTLALADRGKVVEMNVANANNLTIPPNSSVAFPIGTRIDPVQTGAGQTTIVAGAGVTIRQRETKLKLAGQWAGSSLYKRATDEWVLFGDLAA